jgi:hypothetical protein
MAFAGFDPLFNRLASSGGAPAHEPALTAANRQPAPKPSSIGPVGNAQHETVDGSGGEDQASTTTVQREGNASVPYAGPYERSDFSLNSVVRTVRHNPGLMLLLAAVGAWVFVKVRAS